MNVLDIAQNSIAAGSTLTRITIAIDTAAKRLIITIADNGKGMDEKTVQQVTDPFYTTRTTRKVGLGLPLFQEAVRATGGELSICSAVGKGTVVEATFTLGHIDLAPLGDLSGTIAGLVQCNPELDFVYQVTSDGESFCMDTRQLRQLLDGVSLATPQVAIFLREYLEEHTENLLKRSTQI